MPGISSFTGVRAPCYLLTLPWGPRPRALGVRTQLLAGAGAKLKHNEECSALEPSPQAPALIPGNAQYQDLLPSQVQSKVEAGDMMSEDLQGRLLRREPALGPPAAHPNPHPNLRADAWTLETEPSWALPHKIWGSPPLCLCTLGPTIAFTKRLAQLKEAQGACGRGGLQPD